MGDIGGGDRMTALTTVRFRRIVTAVLAVLYLGLALLLRVVARPGGGIVPAGPALWATGLGMVVLDR